MVKILAIVIMVYSILCAVLLADKKDVHNEMLYIMAAVLMAIYLAR